MQMKKTMGLLLIFALSLGSLAALAEEPPREPIGTHLGSVSWADTPYWDGSPYLEGLPTDESGNPVLPEGSDRLIYVEAPGLPGYWMAIPPDGPEAAEYYGKGVRFELDAASISEDTFIVTPVSLAIAGDTFYGTILALSEASITMEGGLGGSIPESPDTRTFHITDDTDHVNPYKEGLTVELLFDENGNALYIRIANG